MKNKFLFLTLILLLLATATISGCKKKQNTADSNVATDKQAMENQNQEEESGENSFYGSMKDLISQGKPVMCTVNSNEKGNKMDSVTYIDGKKARQISHMETDGVISESNMLTDDKTTWVWTDATPGRGIKMTTEMTDKELKEFNEDAQTAEEEEALAMKYNFKCKNWRVDKSKFILPSNIEFQDMNAMLDKIKSDMDDSMDDSADTAMEDANSQAENEIPAEAPQNLDDIKEALCRMCDNAEDQDECRAGLGCE